MRKILILPLAIGIVLFLAACQAGNDRPESSPGITGDAPVTRETDTEPSETDLETPEASTEEWLGISAEGVDEAAFLESMDVELLEQIAKELQALVEEVQQKQIEDPESVLRGDWVSDITGSGRYHKVVNMGTRAMKPLYWIIYKSENQGLYEYICCMALEELSGCDFTDANGTGWATSKDFLDRFTKRIVSKKE